MVGQDFKKNCVPTINKRVQEVEFGHRVTRKKLWLNIKHKLKRLQFAKTYSKFKTDQWKKVLFTDESPYRLTNSKGKQYVWRKQGEEFKQACLVPKFRENTSSIMVWGCITWNGPGPLHFCDGNVNGKHYKSNLEKNLPLAKKKLKLPKDFIFLQDNAPAHTAKLCQEFYKEKKLNLMPFPPNSPDLNPIENVWSHIENEIRYKPLNILEDLKKEVENAWNNMDKKIIQKCIESMPICLEAVKQAKGGSTKY